MPVTITVPKEDRPNERRVALVPAVAAKLKKLGADLSLEAGAGGAALIPDDAYAKADMGTGGENANAASQAATTLTWNDIDADQDGKLSATEVEGYENLKANFAGMDGDGDGFVTQDEYRAYQKANRVPGKP